MIEVEQLVQRQRDYFNTQRTKSVSQRKQLLKTLRTEILKRESAISKALYDDFKKPAFESYVTEIGIVLSELDLAIANLKSWTKPKRIRSTWLNFPSKDYVYHEPYGTTLIIAPWNYPFQLAMSPLIGALAAGNTVVIKPSELTPNTSLVISDIISTVFNKDQVAVIEGGIAVSQALLNQRWDYIFFTGSVPVGKIVAKAAAEYMTPVTLELGGKNPCIIDGTASQKLAAKRIVWGKYLNAGQTCIAPDYVLIKNEFKNQFIEFLSLEIKKAYSAQPEQSEDYPRIVNAQHFDRLTKMLQNETIACGGNFNKETLYIEPTLIDEPKLDSEVMKDEIFGPILPILSYKTTEDIHNVISRYNKPLSLYVFSKKKSFISYILNTYSFGGGAINDTVVQFANHRLPFGGVGHSGIGAYHGKLSFETFSHKKAITKRGNWLDIPFRYAPYKGKLNLMKTILKYF